MGNKNPIGSAVIGYGATHNFGWMHALWMTESPYFNLVAICDRDEERLEQAKKDYPGIETYTSTEALYANQDVEMVTAVTPNFTHRDVVVEALDNGRHTLVENGMCMNVKEAEDMFDASERNGKMLAVHHNRRHDGNYRAIKEIVEAGRIGDIYQIELSPTSYGDPFKGADPDLWWTQREKSGGTFFYYGSQAMDWILDLIPAKVTGVTGFSQKLMWTSTSSEDQVTAILKFENGVVANFTESYIDCSGKPFWRILGTKGCIIDQYGSQIPGYQYQTTTPPCGRFQLIEATEDGYTKESLIHYKASDWTEFYNDMGRHIREGGPNPVSGEVGRRVIGLVDAAKESIETGVTVVPKYN